ncbi:MAG TPA: hypothetical protein VN040_13410 [Pseudosphingobacterium sp.]|nr:hypothetical protein [Pseudosphingobacterium sp.]
MKRAKIVLTGVALFAVIGGALAFKASRLPQKLYRTNAAGFCVAPVDIPLTLTGAPGQPAATITNSLYTTALPGAPCPLTTWYTAE